MPRLIFLEEADADDFEEFAESLGWAEVELDPESYDSEDYPALLWEVPGGGQVRFVEDTVFELKYVDVDTPSRHVALAVRAAFEVRDRDELLELVDLGASPGEITRVLYMLARAAQATPFDQRIFDVVVLAFDADDEDVQIAALAVAGRSRWTQFIPRVAELAENTDSGRVRRFAGNATVILEMTHRTRGGTTSAG